MDRVKFVEAYGNEARQHVFVDGCDRRVGRDEARGKFIVSFIHPRMRADLLHSCTGGWVGEQNAANEVLAGVGHVAESHFVVVGPKDALDGRATLSGLGPRKAPAHESVEDDANGPYV